MLKNPDPLVAVLGALISNPVPALLVLTTVLVAAFLLSLSR